MKKLIKNKRGVFGLTAVQAFFAIILGIALLAYVIVIIMGTLQTASIIPQIYATYVNDSVAKPTTAGVTLSAGALSGGVCGAVTTIYNGTGGISIALGNITQTGCTVKNTSSTAIYATTWLFNYPYTYDTPSAQNSKQILGNVSTGITSFFGSINPVYAILAVLVIILVLVVLVRVVQGGQGRTEGSTQL